MAKHKYWRKSLFVFDFTGCKSFFSQTFGIFGLHFINASDRKFLSVYTFNLARKNRRQFTTGSPFKFSSFPLYLIKCLVLWKPIALRIVLPKSKLFRVTLAFFFSPSSIFLSPEIHQNTLWKKNTLFGTILSPSPKLMAFGLHCIMQFSFVLKRSAADFVTVNEACRTSIQRAVFFVALVITPLEDWFILAFIWIIKNHRPVVMT